MSLINMVFCLCKGLLRQVPLVSSFMNWLSPLPEEPKTIGRTFNLTSGRSFIPFCCFNNRLSRVKCHPFWCTDRTKPLAYHVTM